MVAKKATKKKTSKARKKAAVKQPAEKAEEKKGLPEVKEEPKKAEADVAEKAAPGKVLKKPKKAKKAVKRVKEKVVVARGKRKEAIARATIRPGKGVVRINSMLLDSFRNRYVREIIREPIRYVGPDANSVNIYVNVFGGGSMGQAQAARTAIANALIQFFEGLNLKEKFISIDRSLVVEDTRRVEPKKYKGPKARARYQKSYR